MTLCYVLYQTHSEFYSSMSSIIKALFRHTQYPRIFTTLSYFEPGIHIQPYCDIFRTLYNSCIFRTLPYTESWHIENTRFIQNSVKAYFGTLCNAHTLRTLPYSELCHIQNFATFRTRDIFRYIQ